MKKNKTLAYALAATLLVGGTFLGTKALFTDTLDTVGELAISTGDVDIEVIANEDGATNEWVLNRNGSELSDGTNTELKEEDKPGLVPSISGGEDTWENITASKKANNLKPGDVLEKTITVQNQGTLVADLDLTTNEDIKSKLGPLSDLIEVSGTINDDDEILNPGDKTTLTLTLTVTNKGGQHNKQDSIDTSKGYNTNGIENHKVDLKNAWELIATQQNGDTTTTPLQNN
ncbi:MAG: hypothetical protein ACRDD7_06715 [Peptostreptococcaceae bacterium]